jgi:predicted DNA-binding WGR domain protein
METPIPFLPSSWDVSLVTFLLYFLYIFLSFAHFILAQLLMQLAIKATLVLFSALFTCTRLTCSRCRRRRPPPPPFPPPPHHLSQIIVASAQHQGHGRRLHVTCPVKDHQKNKFYSDFITPSAHLDGDELAVLGTAGTDGGRAVHHFQEHTDATNDGHKLTSEVWSAVAPPDAPASP